MPALEDVMKSLEGVPRFLAEVRLRPVAGDRFQPTGFPDLGPAEYELPDGTRMLLVESAQSMANRMEAVIWDEGEEDVVAALRGMPYVRVEKNGIHVTNSILEAHRLNSPYILEQKDTSVLEALKEKLGVEDGLPVSVPRLARVVLEYDPNALVHGVFLAKSELAGGRYRLARLLTGFIEARNVREAESGGVKIDIVDPQGDTGKGFGNVPYHRTEYVAEEIRAFFNLDVRRLRSYRLPEEAEKFLVALAFYKIRLLLEGNLRLRTACDLEPHGEIEVRRPDGASLPTREELEQVLPSLIGAVAEQGLFADPSVTRVQMD